MRKKVADLMAVAPGLPVRDLYYLLLDLKGDLPAARKQAIRLSRAPSLCAPVKSERTPAAVRPRNVVNISEDTDDDEIMVKIDPNASFLEYDTDTPPPESTRQKKPTAGRSRPTKSNSSRKRKDGAPPRRRKEGENSISREFIVPDDEVEYETDKSSSEDSSEHDVRHDDSDLDMLEPEDLEDLRIDMRRKYAINATILGRRK